MGEASEKSYATVQADLSEIDGKYLTFFTDGQSFGVPIEDVVQIVGLQEITPVPEFPSYAKGIINLRSTIIPLIDMRLRLGREEAEYTDRTCIIVTNISGKNFGFIVDAVDEVTDIEDEAISAPPKLSGDNANRYLTGVARLEDKITLLMNVESILGDDEIAVFTDNL